MEQEEDGRIPFLDTLVERNQDKLTTEVYRKPTHTDRYLHFGSHHHQRILTGIVSCLKNRADKVCSASERSKELHHLKKVFKQNGYPRRLVDRAIHRSRSPQNEEDNENQDRKLLYLPYIHGLSEKIERKCKHLKVKVVFNSQNALRESLMRVKQPRPKEQKNGVIYEVPCADCSHVYVGETGRSMSERIKVMQLRQLT